MAKVRLNPMLMGISGTMAGFVFRRSNKKQEAIISQRPRKTNSQPSAAQLAQRERFAQAIAYAKAAMADPESRSHYEDLATRAKTPFAMAVADYIKNINPK